MPIDYRTSAESLARISDRVAAKLVLTGEDVPPLKPDVGVTVWKLHELELHDVAEIICTSGATGGPIGVVLTHRNVLASMVPVEREVKKYRALGRPFVRYGF